MKKIVAVCLVFAFVVPVFALEEGQVLYVGGTVPTLKESTLGKLDTTQADAIVFVHSGGKLVIPYLKIDSYHYEEKLAHNLGVVATVAIVMLKYRQRRHFYRIAYKDDAGLAQVAVFEVSKQSPQTLSAVLDARVQKRCDLQSRVPCKIKIVEARNSTESKLAADNAKSLAESSKPVAGSSTIR